MMMTLEVVTVSVAVLMAGVPSAAQGKDTGETGVSLKEYHKQLDIFKKAFHAQHRDFKKLREQLLSQDALLDNQRSLIQGLNKKVSTIKGDLSKEKTEREKSDQLEKESRTQSVAQIQERVDTLENTVVRSCSQDSDCADPNHFCFNGWCSIAECNGRSCTAPQPYCVNDTCVECRRNDDCTEAAHPYCFDDTCVECVQNSDCSSGPCDTTSGHCYNWQKKTYCTGYLISSYETFHEATNDCQGSCGCIRDSFCNGGPYKTYVGTETGPSKNDPPSCSWVKT